MNLYIATVRCVFKRKGAIVPVTRVFLVETDGTFGSVKKLAEDLADTYADSREEWVEFKCMGHHKVSLPLEVADGELIERKISPPVELPSEPK